ncbi:forespore capture DNA-binding protein RefZ [Siminovitchia fortis]|uniref:TetR/AcrR family transcriptional regulator n=1 Tax=Siminovitchia fortis TaxID=254758 RepID=A0A443IP85_9BACI|nr:forespore capture DNA-binding protein RefZ [Siminovitchia fortis]RWR07762.1 TetR/AcrR family transcriptional regulator [Siminovitchia fortis]WHY82304.1 forespore capture DNA-binding protein RefZ [Siminovitchia fortis]
MSGQGGKTKEAIIEAAIELFTTKGFKGTTIRDIAARAKLNPANISYYFQGKQGLLEACLVSFFEPYLTLLEEEKKKVDWEDPQVCLHRAIRKVLVFQSDNHLLTRLVWREITIDSQVSREIISSYLMKERYYLKALTSSALGENHSALPVSMMIIQLKGMLSTPFLNSQYVSEVWGMHPKDPYFIEKYYESVIDWIQAAVNVQKSALYVARRPSPVVKTV